jgi:hypothetical protein
MAFEYNDKEWSAFDPVRKLRVREDRSDRELIFDMNQLAYNIFDEDGNKISEFKAAVLSTAGAENAPRHQTYIILHNTIVPHQGISVESIAEALFVLVSKGEASKEEFITMEWAETMFAAQEKHPGTFPGFERWARCYHHPISDGSRPHDPKLIKVLRQPGKPWLIPQDGVLQPDAGSYYRGPIRPVPPTLGALLASTHTSARIGETPDQIAARYGVGHASGSLFPGVTVIYYVKGRYIIFVYFLNGRSIAEAFSKFSNIDWTEEEVGDLLKIFPSDDTSILPASSSFLQYDTPTDAGSADTAWAYSHDKKLWHRGDKSIVAYLREDRKSWLLIVDREAVKQFQTEGAAGFQCPEV